MQREYGFGYAPEYRLSDLTPDTRKLISDYRYAGNVENHGVLVSPDFKSFFKRYKNALKRELGGGFQMVSSWMGHYDGSFVFRNVESGKLLYVSLGDVRTQTPVFAKRVPKNITTNQSFTNIVIREVFSEDGLGKNGSNVWTNIFNLRQNALRVTA